MKKACCPNFNRCGGCLYLDMSLEAYIEKKKNFIYNSFSHEGITITLDNFILIPFGTRRRATFAFKKDLIGFNEQKSHRLIYLDKCPALIDEISELLPKLKPFLKELNKSGDIFIQKTKFGLDVHIKTKTGTPTLNERMLLAELAGSTNISRLHYNNEPILEKSPSPLPIDLFLQPSKEGEDALVQEVLSNISEQDKNIIDLFSGAGTFTTPLLLKGLNAKGYDFAGASILVLKENGILKRMQNYHCRQNKMGISM